MNKGKAIKIIIIVFVVIAILLIGFTFVLHLVHKTIYNKQYGNVYCNKFCVRYDGNSFKQYHTIDDVLDNDGVSYECNIKDDNCVEDIVEHNNDYLITEVGLYGDTYIYYKHPYEAEELDGKIDVDFNNTFYTNGNVEIYIFDQEHVLMASKKFSQAKGGLYSTALGYDNFYEIYFDSTNSYTLKTNDDPPGDFIYDIKKGTFIGYKKGDIKDAKYINISDYDSNGNIEIKNNELNSFYGKYKGELIIKNKEVSNFLDTDKEETIEITNDNINFTVGNVSQNVSYEIVDIDKDYIYLEIDENIYTYNRSKKTLCEFTQYDDDKNNKICLSKIS